MKLPMYARAFSFVVAVCLASALVVTVAEIGHPPADGVGAIAALLLPHGDGETKAEWTAQAVAIEP